MATVDKFPVEKRISSPSCKFFVAISGSNREYPLPCMSTIISSLLECSYEKCAKFSHFSSIVDPSPHNIPLLLRYFVNVPSINSSTVTHLLSCIFPRYTFLNVRVSPYISLRSSFSTCCSSFEAIFFASICIWTTFLECCSTVWFV